MTKLVIIDEVTYKVTDEGKYQREEEMLFEIYEKEKYVYAIGMWDDWLGKPVRKIWKIVGKL